MTYIPNSDFMLQVAAGDITGYSAVNKFGRSTAITTTNNWEVWDGNAAYTWPSSATITHVRAAADSATTQGMDIEVQGLDTNWALTTQTATLDGTNSTTEVALGTALRRCFRMKVIDSAVADQAIWAGPTGFASKQAIIIAGNNQTLMAIYTVPASKTAYLTNYYATANPGGGAPTTFNVSLWAVDNVNGYEDQLKHIQGVSADVDAYGRMQHMFLPYYKFTQKTDIILRGNPTGASVDVSAGFDLVLVDD
jgi:hypothetical protein